MLLICSMAILSRHNPQLAITDMCAMLNSANSQVWHRLLVILEMNDRFEVEQQAARLRFVSCAEIFSYVAI